MGREGIRDWLQTLLLGREHRFTVLSLGVPLIAAILYFGVIAADRYVSVSEIVVKRADQSGETSTGGSLMSALGGSSGAAGSQDVLYLKDYILSANMLERLDKKLDLRRAFALHGLDVFFWLPPWATKEDFLKYYQHRVDVQYDEKSGLLTIETQGFTPEMAKRLNEGILAESEQLINEISHRIAREQLDFASQELSRSRDSLEQAKKALLAYQNKVGMLDPTVLAAAADQVVADLSGQLAANEAQLKALSGMLQPNAVQVESLRQTIAALKAQIQKENSKLASSRDPGMNRQVAEYLDYKDLVDFRSDVYKISLGAYETARQDAVRKLKEVAVIVAPSLAEEAKYPMRVLMVFAAVFLLAIGYGLLRLIVAIVQDHRE